MGCGIAPISSFGYEEIAIYWDAELSAERDVGQPLRHSDLPSLGAFADRLASTIISLLYICIYYDAECIKSLKMMSSFESSLSSEAVDAEGASTLS